MARPPTLPTLAPRRHLRRRDKPRTRRTSPRIVTDWALIAATSSLENIGTGTTRYLLEGNDNQPVHVMTGLFRYASERVIWDDDEDDDE